MTDQQGSGTGRAASPSGSTVDEERTQSLPVVSDGGSVSPADESPADPGRSGSDDDATAAVPRAGAGTPSAPAGSATPPQAATGTAPATPRPSAAATTGVLPAGAPRRPAPRPLPAKGSGPAPTRSGGPRRRARLALRRIDPWSVFLFSLVASLFLAVVLVVAVAALYAVLSSLGVLASINEVFAEVTREPGSAEPGELFTASRFVGGAAVLAAINVVLLTVLATLGALLYNLCASFTGGIEVTLGERD